MRRFGIVGFLVGALLLGGVGLTAYQMGVNEGSTSAAVNAGAHVVYVQHSGGGFPFLGVLLGLLFLGFVVSLFKRAAWRRAGGPGFGPGHGPWGGHGAWGGHGPGGWDTTGDRPVPPPFDAMLGRWHQAAHGTAPGATPPTTGMPPAGPASGGTTTGEPGS